MNLRPALLAVVLLAATTLLAPVAAAAAAGVPLLTPIVPHGSWPVYHHDDGHTGHDPALSYSLTVGPGWTSAPMDAQVYADRKSTRLNSSHLVISYAVFCL